MMVALIGPNGSSRKVMAKALANSESRTVREFDDYPANLTEVARMMAQNFDVVMIDFDSDQSYALQIVESIAAIGDTTVMVYSVRNDPSLVAVAMRAGASEFVPIPAEEVAAAPAEPPPAKVDVQKDGMGAAEHSMQFAPKAPIAAPARPAEAQDMTRKPLYNAAASNGQRSPQPIDVRRETPTPDVNQRETVQLRPVQTSSSRTQEVTLRSAVVSEPPARANVESRAPVVPATPAQSAGGIETDADVLALFRHGQVLENRNEEADRKKWIFVAAAGSVVVVLLVLVLTRSFWKSAPAAPKTEAVATIAAPTTEAVSTSTLATPTPSVAKPSAASPIAKTGTPGAPAETKDVQPDMMNAQLSAPERISSALKKPTQSEDAPAPLSIDGGSVPGAVFGGQSKVRVVANVSAISAGVAEGMLIHKTQPVYPAIAKQSRVSGTVVVKANITKNGTLGGLHIVSGPKMLQQPALDAVANWRYRPYMLNNQPVEVETTISVVFSLGQQ
jgi:protein TonB